MSNYNYVNRVLIGDGTNSGAVTALPGIEKGDLLVLDGMNSQYDESNARSCRI